MKKILRLLKRKNNGGFTLIEVIISCVLLAILILAVMGMISPVMSVVVSNEKNANALMIAEAVEAHIDRNIKNSVYCAVFTNANWTDITAPKIDEHAALKEMKDFLNEGDNKKIYDLKVIGIRWKEDTKSHQYKYMLETIRPDYDESYGLKSAIARASSVFEDCFYDNLYPDIKFETIPFNEYAEDGTTKKSTGNVAVKTTIEVYSNHEMTALAAKGTGYAEFINIRTKAINPDGNYKLYYIVDNVDDPDDSKDWMGNDINVFTQLRTDAEFEADFGDTAHPETYIFYVTRKLKFAEPASSTP